MIIRYLVKYYLSLIQFMYPELQEAELPKMIGLNGSEWTEDKVQDKFWQFTDEVKALESKEHAGYLLKRIRVLNG